MRKHNNPVLPVCSLGCAQTVYSVRVLSGITFGFVHRNIVRIKVVHFFGKLSTSLPYLFTPTYPHQMLAFTSVKSGLYPSSTDLITITTYKYNEY